MGFIINNDYKDIQNVEWNMCAYFIISYNTCSEYGICSLATWWHWQCNYSSLYLFSFSSFNIVLWHCVVDQLLYCTLTLYLLFFLWLFAKPSPLSLSSTDRPPSPAPGNCNHSSDDMENESKETKEKESVSVVIST